MTAINLVSCNYRYNTNYYIYNMDNYKYLVKDLGSINEDWSDALDFVFKSIKNVGGEINFSKNYIYGFSKSIDGYYMNKVLIRGESGTIIKKNPNFDSSNGIRLLNMNKSSNLVIKNIKFIGISGSNNTDWNDTILMNYDCQNVVIDNCKFENAAIALNIGSYHIDNSETICSNITIQNCDFNNVGQCYTTHPGGAKKVIFRNNIANNVQVMYKTSCRIKNKGNIEIYNNIVTNTTIGFDFVNTPNINCYNNTIINAKEYGIQTETYENTKGTEHEGTSYDIDDWTINNNNFQDCNVFIRLTTDKSKVLSDVNIKNNKFTNKTINGIEAIIIQSNVKNINIENNIFSNIKLKDNSFFYINSTYNRFISKDSDFGEISNNTVNNCTGEAFIKCDGSQETLKNLIVKNNTQNNGDLAFIINDCKVIENASFVNNKFNAITNAKEMITGTYKNTIFKNNDIRTLSAEILANIKVNDCSIIKNRFESMKKRDSVSLRMVKYSRNTVLENNNFNEEVRILDEK